MATPASDAVSSPPHSSSSQSPLTPIIASTRSLVESGVNSVSRSEHSAATYWNSQVAQPANQQLHGRCTHTPYCPTHMDTLTVR